MMFCVALVIVLTLFLCLVKFDPIDDHLLINEQSLHISAKISTKFTKNISIDIRKLKEEFFEREVYKYLTFKDVDIEDVQNS